jgi:16S rRNA (guanine(966)-N(2))-methyltransferase RsmD
MRIIGGKLGKRKINTPKNLRLRPTTDQAKEALFNILEHRFYLDEINVLDLFSGTGSISYEFISRGAISVTCVENNLTHFKFITSVKSDFDMDNLFPLKTDVFKFLDFNSQTYDLIFADPPFDMPDIDKIPNRIFEKNHLSDNGVLILEHSEKYNFSENQHFSELRNYGKVHFSFFGKNH